MPKLIAIANTVAWGGFWAFGFLALGTPVQDAWTLIIAACLAMLGALLGLGTYMYLVRYTEATGYARRANRAV